MTKDNTIAKAVCRTPCGLLLLGAVEGRLCLCTWLDESENDVNEYETEDVQQASADTRVLQEAVRQLHEYFSGQRREFSLPLRMEGTPFQQKAWKAMQTIPYGQTISYAEEARRAGHPTALRAIGNANHRNPIAVIVPCHRVVASHGKIGGYGGGLDRKRFLLNLECSDILFRTP